MLKVETSIEEVLKLFEGMSAKVSINETTYYMRLAKNATEGPKQALKPQAKDEEPSLPKQGRCRWGLKGSTALHIAMDMLNTRGSLEFKALQSRLDDNKTIFNRKYDGYKYTSTTFLKLGEDTITYTVEEQGGTKYIVVNAKRDAFKQEVKNKIPEIPKRQSKTGTIDMLKKKAELEKLKRSGNVEVKVED